MSQLENDQQDVIETPDEETEVETEVETDDAPVEEDAAASEETEEGNDAPEGDSKPKTDAEKDALIAELEKKNKKLYARIQRDKGKSAGGKSKDAKPEVLSKEEAILFAKGLDVEDVEKAKKIAEIEGIDLLKVPDSLHFTTYKTDKDRKAEVAKAQLGGSKGAKASVKKTFNTPGLSDADHEKLFKEKNAR